MSKYDIGDKFVIEIDDVRLSSKFNPLYDIKNFNGLILSEEELNRLLQFPNGEVTNDMVMLTEEEKEYVYNKGLEDGRNEVWDFVDRILSYDYISRKEIWGYKELADITLHYTPQEALAKLEAYEKEQTEIKVGDVVCRNNTKKLLLVTNIYNNETFEGIDRQGIVYQELEFKYWHKTGNNIDISSILEQIKES